ncbi:MAG: FAA hydrolase family protein [Burkholderiales bacterium]|nr:MAG: FAA hydrolase family protein [Burkholderiales bacterium]
MNAPTSKQHLAPAYIFSPPPAVSLPVQGEAARFAVNRIFCVGRNYADHAKEMGHDPSREPPFFFMKPASTIVSDGGHFPYPALSKDVHHEIELVVCLSQGGKNISADQALSHVYGYAVGLDMTRRDLQSEAKKMGRPWDTGKAFDHSAPCGTVLPAAQCGHLAQGVVVLTVNGQPRQSGDLKDLIWNVPETIAYLSTLFELSTGDLIYTGTPAGVGPVVAGDVMLARIAGLPDLAINVV